LADRKTIAMIAHDRMKDDIADFTSKHQELLAQYDIVATGTTGGRILDACPRLAVRRMKSGPLGGDQQIGAKIVEGEIDFLIFFWDPLEPQPHDPDVKALLRMAVVWNIPTACDRATADFMISSPLMDKEYPRLVPDYDVYRSRKVPGVETPPIPIPGVHPVATAAPAAAANVSPAR